MFSNSVARLECRAINAYFTTYFAIFSISALPPETNFITNYAKLSFFRVFASTDKSRSNCFILCDSRRLQAPSIWRVIRTAVKMDLSEASSDFFFIQVKPFVPSYKIKIDLIERLFLTLLETNSQYITLANDV